MRKVLIGLVCIGALVLGALVLEVGKAREIKIGVSLSLTSQGAEKFRERLALTAARLAVKEINEAGGIKGRKLVLIAVDDKGTSEGVFKAVKFLLREGVLAIIGHSNSTTTLKSYLFIKRINADVVLLAPFAASSRFSKKDDFLIRTSVSNDYYAEKVIDFMRSKLGIRKVAICSSFENPIYQNDLIDRLMKASRNRIKLRVFRIREETAAGRRLVQLAAFRPEAVFFITPFYFTISIIKELHKMGFKAYLIGSTWTMVPELIRYGGDLVEGMLFVTFYDPDHDTPMRKRFKRRMKELFSVEPGPVESSAYEAVYVLAEALRRTKKFTPSALKKALLSIKHFPGMFSTISFNKYGDVVRPLYVVKIEKGRFRLYSKLK